MYCPNCGTEIPDDSIFCPNCGAPVAPAGPSVAPGSPASRRAIALAAGAGALAVVAAAVAAVLLVVEPFGGGDGEDAIAEARDVDPAQLVLGESDVPGEFELSEEERTDNQDAAENACDPDAYLEGLQLWGRLEGYENTFEHRSADEFIHSGAVVYGTIEGARESFNEPIDVQEEELRCAARAEGLRIDNFRASKGPRIGDEEAWALRMEVSSFIGVEAQIIAVSFRRANVLGVVARTSIGGSVSEDDVVQLARRQDEIIKAALAGAAPFGESVGAIETATPTPAVAPTPTPALTPPPVVPEEPLRIGVLVPLTGALSDFGPTHENAARLAAKEINAAGGVLGHPIEIVAGDTGTNPEQGVAEATRLIEMGKVPAILGALSSAVTLTIVESVTGPNRVVQISPAACDPRLTHAVDNDFFFRLIEPVEGGCGPSSLNVPAGEAFDAAYEAEYGAAPPLLFMREMYDAVYLVALAAEKAGSTDSTAIRDALREVTNAPGERVSPGTEGFQTAKTLLRRGIDIDYEGAAGPIDFDRNGDIVR